MDSKPWYTSKTVWGAVIGLGGAFCPKVIAALGGTDMAADQIVNLTSAIATAIGAGLAIYGRLKANGGLTLK
jgi:hypothetical protein